MLSGSWKSWTTERIPYKLVPRKNSNRADDGTSAKEAQRRVRLDQNQYNCQPSGIPVLALLCVALSAFCALLLVNTIKIASLHHQQTEVTGLVPQMPRETYIFQATEKTTDTTPSILPRYDWDRVDSLTQRYGLINLPNATADAHNIAPSAWGSDVYSTTMFHQLHCLVLLHSAIRRLSPAAATTHHDAHLDVAHLDHCLDFLRQGVMCAGDLSIEVPRPFDDVAATPNFFINGWGTRHVCRSWGAMLEWIEGHQREGEDGR